MRLRSWQGTRIHAQEIIAVQPRMHMDVQVRHFLKRRRANRVPQAQALVRKGFANRCGDLDDAGHEGSAGAFIQFPDIRKMCAWNDQCVTRMELPEADERQRQLILMDDAGRGSAVGDLAEDALIGRDVSHFNCRRNGDPSRRVARKHDRWRQGVCGKAMVNWAHEHGVDLRLIEPC